MVGLAGNDLRPQGRVGCQDAIEANEMKPRTGNECRQALEEFQWAHHEMGRAITVRGFELEDDLAGRGTAQAFVAEGRTRDVAAQTFEGVPLMGTASRIGKYSVSITKGLPKVLSI